MRHLLIGLLAMLMFFLVTTVAASYCLADDPLLPSDPPLPSKPAPAEPAQPAAKPGEKSTPEKTTPAQPESEVDAAAIEAVFGAKAAAGMEKAKPADSAPSEPSAKAPASIDRLPPRQSFSFNTLYDGRMQRNPIGTYSVRTPDEAPWINDPLGNGELPPDTGILRGSSSLYRGKSPIFRDRLGRSAVEQRLLDQGYGVTGKLPILPAKPDARATDAAGNVLPSLDPQRNLSGPTLGNARTTRNPVIRNRLSPTQRIEEPLYRGPSRPGMIAPRAQQERLNSNARELGRPQN